MHEIKRTDYRKGWLIPYMLALDYKFYQRWDYWTRAVLQDKIPDEAIPYISFKPSHVYQQRQVIKNINKCLSYAEYRHSNVLEKFIDWILWGFNRIDSFPAIDETIDDYWYRTFNLGLFYEEPGDHFAEIAAESNIGKGSGYFPTPGHVVELMVRMNFGDEPSHEHKHLSVLDPCCGTGVMLLYASNYSLNLYGNDIHPLILHWMVISAENNSSIADTFIGTTITSTSVVFFSKSCGNIICSVFQKYHRRRIAGDITIYNAIQILV